MAYCPADEVYWCAQTIGIPSSGTSIKTVPCFDQFAQNCSSSLAKIYETPYFGGRWQPPKALYGDYLFIHAQASTNDPVVFGFFSTSNEIETYERVCGVTVSEKDRRKHAKKMIRSNHRANFVHHTRSNNTIDTWRPQVLTFPNASDAVLNAFAMVNTTKPSEWGFCYQSFDAKANNTSSLDLEWAACSYSLDNNKPGFTTKCTPFVPLRKAANTLPDDVPIVSDVLNYELKFRLANSKRDSDPGEDIVGAIIVVSGLVQEIQQVCKF